MADNVSSGSCEAAGRAGLGERRAPRVGRVGDPADRRVNTGVRAGCDREPDVAFTAPPHKSVGAISRIGSHQDRSSRQRGIIAAMVTGTHIVGELIDRSVQHGEVIANGVRPRVARPQDRGERFAGRVSEAEHRVEPEPALVGRRGALLVLRVDSFDRPSGGIAITRKAHRTGTCRVSDPSRHLDS